MHSWELTGMEMGLLINNELQDLISNLFPFFPLMPNAGFTITNKEIEDIIDQADDNGNGSVEFEEFINVIKGKMEEIDFDGEIAEAFRIFDTEGWCKIKVSKVFLNKIFMFRSKKSWNRLTQRFQMMNLGFSWMKSINMTTKLFIMKNILRKIHTF